MGYNLDDLIGEDGELREPMPPRKKKPRDPNYWRNLLMAVGVEIVLGIVVTLAALLLFGDGGDGGRQNNDVSTLVAILGATHTPTATETPDATLTREALFVELTQTAAAWTSTPSITPSATLTNTATATVTDTPTVTHTPSATETEKPTVTFTPSDTPTVTLTATPSYQGITRDSAPTVTALYELTGHTTWVYALAWSPDSAFLASAGEFEGRESIWIWDVASASVISRFPAHDDRILSLSWSGDLIASSSEDNTVRVWNTSGQEVRQFTNFTNAVECVSWSPDGSMLAAASQDGTLAVWNMPGGGEAHRINAGYGSLTCVTWSPDADFIATIGNSDQVRVYSAATGAQVRTMEGPGFSGAEVIWSPDGRLIATRSETALLQVWNAEGGNQIGVGWQGRDPAWSPEGTMLAGNLSRVVYIWDMDDDPGQFGQVLAQMPGHTGSISAVVWSADGRYIASSGEDRTIRIWGVAP